MGETSRTHRRHEKCIPSFGRSVWRKRSLGRPRRRSEDNTRIYRRGI